MIKTLLLVSSITLNTNWNRVSIFTNTQCGDVCVEVEVEKARVMIFSMEGYIEKNAYINRGLNKINTSKYIGIYNLCLKSYSNLPH